VIAFNRGRPVDVGGSRHCFRRATELAARGQGLPARLLPTNFACGEDRAWRSEAARIRELSESAGREPAGPMPLGMQLSVDISLSVEPAKLSQLLSSRRELSLTLKRGTNPLNTYDREFLMSTDELLEQLIAQLSKLGAPAIPVSVDLWDTRMIGAYLKRSLDTVRDDIVTLPTFPRPIRLPVRSATRAHALYKAREVIAWAERHTS
jgi:hypothetical protein